MPKEPAAYLTYQDALNEYFGGIKGLSKSALPFKCKCGENTYPVDGLTINGQPTTSYFPIMTIGDIYAHVKKIHHERIRNPKKEKLKVVSKKI